MWNVYVRTTKCICQNCLKYASKLWNAFVQTANIFVHQAKENDEDRRKVKLAPSPATWWQIVQPGESQPKPGGFPHNPPPGFIMHHWEILRFLEIFAIYFQLSQTMFLERFLFPTMNGGGGSVDSLRGIREFDSCLSARVWVEVFAQVSSIKFIRLNCKCICLNRKVYFLKMFECICSY